ncbi:MAG: flagellar biosynthesis anti-sigma factor FlgM [Bilifractor sp.]|jgi:anti-sigma28 factor (negative regulator of flagellin synthesis)
MSSYELIKKNRTAAHPAEADTFSRQSFCSRGDKIAALRHQVQSGEYHADPALMAECMLNSADGPCFFS